MHSGFHIHQLLQQIYISRTEYVYVCRLILTVNCYYFCTEHELKSQSPVFFFTVRSVVNF